MNRIAQVVGRHIGGVTLRIAIAGLAVVLAAVAHATSTENILYTFTGSLDGGLPYPGVIFDAAGNLYGTTESGGLYGRGTVFELSPNAGGWTETVLYNFGANSLDGLYPTGGVVFDSAGNLWGTTFYGGNSGNCQFACGTVFKISPSSNGWTETGLLSFFGTNGQNPYSGLVIDKHGNLYGTTQLGGANNAGTVFEVSTSGLSVLHSFAGTGGDGANPFAGVTMDKTGNLYGTTFSGCGAGCVFELAHSGGHWKEKILHGFTSGTGIGGYPEGGVVFDAKGNLYGTTTQGGANGSPGGVFKLKPGARGKWSYTVLHSFSGGNDGAFPVADVSFDAKGNLYSTTEQGGTAGDGTVFELTPVAKGPWKEKILHGFTGGKDGSGPSGGVVRDASGKLFGTTRFGGASASGVVFEVVP